MERPSIYTTIAAVVVIASVLLIQQSSLINRLAVLHQVPEGHVGLYWLGGALQKTTTSPGFHLMVPLLTYYDSVQVTVKTDVVRNVSCGTKGGLVISFDSIEVVNKLRKDLVYETVRNYTVDYDHLWIYNNIRHHISQFCSEHSMKELYFDLFKQIGETMKDAIQGDCALYAPGIEIIRVSVTKPVIPDSIRKHFDNIDEERTKAEPEPEP